MNLPLEVCLATDDLAQLSMNTQAVLAEGATRVELCSNMAEEGLTPSLDAIRIVKDIVGDNIEILAMLRPSGGGFCYSPKQIEQMLTTMPAMKKAGADGVVAGVLTTEKCIDYPTLNLLLHEARNLGLCLTFHRAFDAINNPHDALEQCIQLGVNRVLTSGTHWLSKQGAEQGIPQLLNFIEQVGDKLEIVVGGGVNLTNVFILRTQLASKTGKLSFHTYSAVLTANQVDRAKVAAMVSSLA